MDDLEPIIKERILTFLGSYSDEWAHASQIAKEIGHNRITIGKYLEILKAHNLVETKTVAQAKLWRLAKAKKPTILVVDDEPHIVELIKLTLGEENYTLIEANNGIDGLMQVSRHSPQLVILDLMMPHMSGFEVCQRLKENPQTSHIPVLIITARSDQKDKIKGITAGADEYIVKPFDPLELEARVASLIKRNAVIEGLNPISKLPQNTQVLAELNKIKTVSGLHVALEKYDDFQRLYGYKRGTETIELLARMIQHCANTNDSAPFIAHYNKTEFFMIVKNPSAILDCITSQFESLLPFFYNDVDCSLANKSEVSCMRDGQKIIIPVLKLHITTFEKKPVTKELLSSLHI